MLQCEEFQILSFQHSVLNQYNKGKRKEGEKIKINFIYTDMKKEKALKKSIHTYV